MSIFTQQKKEELRRQIAAFRDGPKQRIPDGLVEIDYKVLQDAVGSFVLPANTPRMTEDWDRREVDDKMDYNHLSQESRDIINSSIVYSNEVHKFIRMRAAHNSDDFPDKLIGYFKGVYAEYKSNGLKDDELFDALHVHLNECVRKKPARKASIAILSHLFETCEVFEK